jgi:hypothetical protein
MGMNRGRSGPTLGSWAGGGGGGGGESEQGSMF